MFCVYRTINCTSCLFFVQFPRLYNLIIKSIVIMHTQYSYWCTITRDEHQNEVENFTVLRTPISH